MTNSSIETIAERYAETCMPEEIELLRKLGSIPAPSRHEDKRARFVREWLIAQGAEDVTIDEAKNVICKIGPQDGDLVVFASHTDVVFPDTEPFEVIEENGRMHAPGIGDDTANLTNLLMCAKYVLQNPVKPKCGILFVANSCEEGLGNLDGTKALFKTYGKQIRAFHSFDGYTPQCCSCAVGSYRYRVSCHTQGGHSYMNFGEPNAIEIICRLVAELRKIEVPTEVKTTFNVGRIEGGTTVNSLPQDCFMLFEFRSTSQKCLSIMEEKFNAAVEKIRAEIRAEVPEGAKGWGIGKLTPGVITVELLGVRPGNGNIDSAALQAFTDGHADVIRRYYDGPIDFDAYSTDSNVPLSMGILANTIGTVRGANAHTREEWIDIASLVPGLKIAMNIVLPFFEL